MLDTLLAKVFGTENQRLLKRLQPLVAQINDRETEIRALTDEQLRERTARFRQRIDQGETLDDLLVDAFAVVREAGWRTLEMRHFDVQLIGGMVLHRGTIAEMKTGEGKTLVGHPGGLPQCPRGPGGACRHRQRLPRPARLGVDGSYLPVPGS